MTIDIEKLKDAAMLDIGDKIIWSSSNVLELIARLEAAEQDAERYQYFRNDPPTSFSVRKFPGETARGMYLDGYKLDEQVDEAMKKSK